MKQYDKNSLITLLSQTHEVCQNISRQIGWTADDSNCLDNLMSSREWQKDIRTRTINASASNISSEIVPFFIIHKAWQRTKAVYSFNKELVADMSQAEDTRLLTYLLEHLPYKDMLFFFPEGVLPLLNSEEIAGMYVHVEKHPEHLWIVLNCLNRKRDKQIIPGIGIAFPTANEMKVSQIFETPEFERWRLSYKIMALNSYHMDEQRVEELILSEKRMLSTAVNLLYYLSSKKPDIKEIKNHKKTRKAPSGSKEEKVPAVDLREVGAEYGKIIYRRWKDRTASNGDIGEDDEINGDEINTQTTSGRKKKRPHPRKGHFQTYWTGKGRMIPEVLWISDMFVGANQDDLTAFVYADVGKSTYKGKRNPNTSKKKQAKH